MPKKSKDVSRNPGKITYSISDEMFPKLEEERKRRAVDGLQEVITQILSEYFRGLLIPAQRVF